MSIEEGLAILKQMASGLVAIHTAGIVHRDIKPNNIMLDGSGSEMRFCITDFGLARAYESETSLFGRGCGGRNTRLYCSGAVPWTAALAGQ